jgi:hypothetical protein
MPQLDDFKPPFVECQVTAEEIYLNRREVRFAVHVFADQDGGQGIKNDAGFHFKKEGCFEKRPFSFI